jgi:hypothetical protein
MLQEMINFIQHKRDEIERDMIGADRTLADTSFGAGMLCAFDAVLAYLATLETP